MHSCASPPQVSRDQKFSAVPHRSAPERVPRTVNAREVPDHNTDWMFIYLALRQNLWVDLGYFGSSCLVGRFSEAWEEQKK